MVRLDCSLPSSPPPRSNDVMYDARWGEGLLVELDLTGSGNGSSDAFAAYENFTASLASTDYFDLVRG